MTASDSTDTAVQTKTMFKSTTSFKINSRSIKTHYVLTLVGIRKIFRRELIVAYVFEAQVRI